MVKKPTALISGTILLAAGTVLAAAPPRTLRLDYYHTGTAAEIGRASCRERVFRTV